MSRVAAGTRAQPLDARCQQQFCRVIVTDSRQNQVIRGRKRVLAYLAVTPVERLPGHHEVRDWQIYRWGERGDLAKRYGSETLNRIENHPLL